jgi:CHAT domain-containing protein/Flp pilus assembly protein TadD
VRILSAHLLSLLTILPAIPPAEGRATGGDELSAKLEAVDRLWAEGDRDSAAALTEALLAGARERGDTSAIVDLLTRSGQQAFSMSTYRRGELACREAARLAWFLGDTTRTLRARRWLERNVAAQGRRSEAERLGKESLELARRSGDAHHEGWAWVGQGWYALLRGEPDVGIAAYAEAVRLFRAIGETYGQLWALNGLGEAQQSKGRFDDAARSYRETADLARANGFLEAEAFALNNLGTLEYARGDPGRAMGLFRRAGKIQERRGIIRMTIIPRINVALCNKSLGRFREAEEELRDCLRICQEQDYSYEAALVLDDLSIVCWEQGRFHEAARWSRTALALGEERLSVRGRVGALRNLARALAMMDSMEAAVAVFSEAVESVETAGNADLHATLNNDLGTALLSVGRPAEALDRFRKAFAIASRQGNGNDAVEALVGLAQAFRAAGRADSSLKYLRMAAAAWEGMRGLPRDPVWREARGEQAQKIYVDLARLLLGPQTERASLEKVGRAFDRLQVFKARTLLERMLGPGEAIELRTREGFQELATLARLRGEVLRPGELFLDFYVGYRTSLLFAVTVDSLRAVLLPGAEELDERLTLYHRLVSKPPNSRVDTRDLAPLRAAARELAQLLLGPVGDLIRSSGTVIVSPDGEVSGLPLAQLHEVWAGGDPQPVGEAAASRHGPPTRLWLRVPSATILSQLRERRRPEPEAPRLLVLAGPAPAAGRALPGVLREARSLSEKYRAVEVFGTRSSRSLSVSMGQADVIHVAAHLALDEQNPWQSEIQLDTPGSPSNLRAYRVAGLDLPARLAFLSSCSSARGRVLSGEGVIGATTAFLSAGVPAVVATLWPVDDRVTVRLVETFYECLARGKNVGVALLEARARIREDPATADPFYWAGFVLVGDPEIIVPLMRRPRLPIPPLLAAGLLLLALAVSVAYARSRI